MVRDSRVPGLVIAFSLIAAACGFVPGFGPGQTHVDGTEEQPGPGSVVVEGDPPNATAPLVIQFVGSEGNVVEERTASHPERQRHAGEHAQSPRGERLLVNETLCEGNFKVETDKRTHVVLRVSDSGCSVRTTSTEPI